MIALLDNTVLSNFTAVGRPDLVRLALGKDAATSEAAWAELQTGIHIGKLPTQDWSWLSVLPLTEAEKPLYELFAESLNAGEASCLAIAASRGYRVFTDDRDARKLAAESKIPVSGTLGLLLRLVDENPLPGRRGCFIGPNDRRWLSFSRGLPPGVALIGNPSS